MKIGTGNRQVGHRLVDGVDGVAESAGLHENGGVAARGKGAAGYADGLFLPGRSYNVEIGVVLQQGGDPVYADVGDEGYEGYLFLL